MGRRELRGHATLDDVARSAGVSRATAARALGGYGSASAKARARVMAAAAELRYRPNAVARSMKSGSTATLGVVVSDIQLAFFSQAVRGIADAAHAEGFEVILANTDEDLAAERAAVGVLLDKRVDGLIVVPSDPAEAAHLLDAQDRGTPVVLLDRGSPGIRCDVVVVDNQMAARNAVRHLVRLGHRRVGIVLEGRSAISAREVATARLKAGSGMTSPLREVGWAAALREAGIPVTEDLISRALYDRDDARSVTAAALALPDRPTALVTTDETMTLGAIDAILDAGLEIPGDISLVAFDDLPWTTLIRPPLTVVAQPVHELGVTATQYLLGRLAGFDGPPETVIMRTAFIVRGSTGPVPDAAPRPSPAAEAAATLFNVESGIISTSVRNVRDTDLTEAFPYLPGLVGQADVELVLGKGSGIDSVVDGLERIGRRATPDEQMAILSEVKALSLEHKRLTIDEFAVIVDRMVK